MKILLATTLVLLVTGLSLAKITSLNANTQTLKKSYGPAAIHLKGSYTQINPGYSDTTGLGQ